MFAAFGIALALYTVLAAATGQVWSKSGPGGRTVSREASPERFWIVITLYAGLSVALILFF